MQYHFNSQFFNSLIAACIVTNTCCHCHNVCEFNISNLYFLNFTLFKFKASLKFYGTGVTYNTSI